MIFGARLHQPSHLLGAIVLAVLLRSPTASAGTLAQGGEYTLQPDVVGAAGTTMHGGTWTLDGTVAQADAIVQEGSGGVRLAGGFWPAAQNMVASDRIFENGFDPAADSVAATHVGRISATRASADGGHEMDAHRAGTAHFADGHISTDAPT